MSANKMKYWEVTTTNVVKALNKTEALSIANKRPLRVGGVEVMATFVDGERIAASEARALVDQTV